MTLPETAMHNRNSPSLIKAFPTALLILLFFGLSSAHGQTRTEKIHNSFGLHMETRAYTKLGPNEEKVEITLHIPGESDTIAGKYIYTLVNGEKEGKFHTYSTATTLLETYTYSKGIPHGPYARYYSNGQVQYSGTYVNGKQEGETKGFYSNGNLRYRAFYVNNNYEGDWVSYHENGKTRSKGVYKNGKREGLWKSYNEQGVLESDKRYVNGEEDPSYVSPEKLPPPCPDLKKMRGLCLLMNHTRDDEIGGRYKWRYQRKVLEAACVDIDNDSESVLMEKIQSMWAEYEQSKWYYCSSITFDVQQGNILKFAVNYGFEEFLYDMIRWKIDLNKIDESDKRTVLDYIEARVELHKGNAPESYYRSYYNLLRQAGAKHARELK